MHFKLYHNRTSKLSANYVGLMIKTLPVGVHFDKIKNNAELLTQVKNQINDGIENCDYDYFKEYESVFNSDCMEVYFVGNLDFDTFGQRLKYESIELERNDFNASARLEIKIWDGEKVTIEAHYLANIYKEENIDRFMKLYFEAFEELVKGI